jgi:uncharacterized protein YcaQ
MQKTKPREITKEDAKRFLILRQSFLQEKEGKEGTLRAIRNLECVQIDPISVLHRNQHLVLYNRVNDYRTSYLEELLYKDRSVFEYWCNEKSIVPIEELRHFRYRMKNSTEFQSPYYEHIKKKRKELQAPIDRIVSQITANGPLSSQELEKRQEIKSRVITDVLNLLWDSGDLMIHHVEENRRYYDLSERVLPSNTNMETPSREEYEQFIIRKYMRAYGLVDARDWRFGWLPLKASEKKAIVRNLVDEDELITIKVEGVKQEYYALRDVFGAVDLNVPMDHRIYFIAPLDNLLWNRKVISEIFDFDYAWEVYKIPEKRIHGYYVMPILRGTRFIGRIDPRLDRQNRKMIINSLSITDKTVDKSIIDDLATSLRRFCEFHGVSDLDIQKMQPLELRKSLEHELNQHI